jgi:methylenetetrahydrofolate reductase (NADPH)
MAQSSGMSVVSSLQDASASRDAIGGVAELARRASIEINVQEIGDLAAARASLPAGTKIYVSHLPKQTWEATIAASVAVHAAGFDPVPHVPVRMLAHRDDASRLFASLTDQARVAEVLLISGDHSKSHGPYSTTLEVLRSGLLSDHGLTRVSFAGHPEGHPAVTLDEIRRAEADKAQWARNAGLPSSFVTQFFFESAPFEAWASDMRSRGVQARIVAGVAGPATIAKLVRFAVQCGVGRSIRALSARPGVMTKLLEEQGPETLLSELAQMRAQGTAPFDGIHLFGFGGFLRTCQWLRRAAAGSFHSATPKAGKSWG